MDLSFPWVYVILQIVFVSAAIATTLLTGYAIYFLLRGSIKERGHDPKAGLCECECMFLEPDQDHIISDDEDEGDEEVWHDRHLCQPLRETISQVD